MDVQALSSSPPAHLGTAYATVRTEVLTATAEKLGISVDQLRSELEAGTPLSDIAAVATNSVSRTHVLEPAPQPERTVDVQL